MQPLWQEVWGCPRDRPATPPQIATSRAPRNDGLSAPLVGLVAGRVSPHATHACGLTERAERRSLFARGSRGCPPGKQQNWAGGWAATTTRSNPLMASNSLGRCRGAAQRLSKERTSEGPPYSTPNARFVARNVFTSSIARVMGPTPPGTGVMAATFSDTGP